MQEWERREGESEKHYHAFKLYLETRDAQKCSEMTNLSVSHIRRLMAKNDWKYRAAKFDSSLMEEARQEIKRNFASKMIERWKICDELQQRAFEALQKKDLSKASFKTLNEIFHSAVQLQLNLADKLKFWEEKQETPQNFVINIIPKENRDD